MEQKKEKDIGSFGLTLFFTIVIGLFLSAAIAYMYDKHEVASKNENLPCDAAQCTFVGKIKSVKVEADDSNIIKNIYEVQTFKDGQMVTLVLKDNYQNEKYTFSQWVTFSLLSNGELIKLVEYKN